jgi:hypothetical protein
MKRLWLLGIMIFGLMIPSDGGTYPLDGYAYTGIARLEAYRLAMEGKVRAPRQPAGALLPSSEVNCSAKKRNDIMWRCWT